MRRLTKKGSDTKFLTFFDETPVSDPFKGETSDRFNYNAHHAKPALDTAAGLQLAAATSGLDTRYQPHDVRKQENFLLQQEKQDISIQCTRQSRS